MVTEPEKPKEPDFIKEPFNTAIDVTPDTPIDQYPLGYNEGTKQRMIDTQTELNFIQQGIEGLAVDPDIEELLMCEAHQSISRYDDHIIKAAFHVGLSTYLTPLNLALKCESGSGKTYSTNETIQFLPQEDIQYIASQSPKVISHENGIRKTQDGEIIDETKAPQIPDKSDKKDNPQQYKEDYEKYLIDRKEWREKLDHSYYEVDVRNKVIVFQESINPETFAMFKTTMSHDHPYSEHKFVDDKGKVHVTRIVGAPALIFNSLDKEYLEEFATRNLTATPNTTQPKIRNSMEISNKKACYPWIYQQEQIHKKIIQEYIRKIKQFILKGKITVATPFDGLHEAFTDNAIRDMRDFNKFLELMPSYTAFKLFQRPIIIIAGHRYIIPTIQDALDAKQDYNNILETTKTGTDARVTDFYHKIIAKHPNGAEAETLTDEYNKDRKQPISTTRVRAWLQRLQEIGWVDIREGTHENTKGYIDKRYNNYLPLKPKETLITLNSDSSALLEEILQNSFKTWLKNTLAEIDTTQIIILNIDGTAKKITLEDMIVLITNIKNKGGVTNSKRILNDASKPKEEKKNESTLIQEISVDAHISQESSKPIITNHSAIGESEIRDTYKQRITLIAKRIKPTAGVICTGEAHGNACIKEAEYNFNGNLYCPEHFEKAKKDCVDNDYAGRRLIKLFSFYGDIVLDPFSGSGTTAMVSKQLGRNYLGFELNPDFCKTARSHY